MGSRASRRRGGNAGFTLMEVMIASLLISVVMGAVYTLFHSTLVTWRTIERGYDAHKEGRDFIALLQREMHNVLPSAGHLFSGEATELTMFVAAEPVDVSEAAGRHLMQVRYRYNQNRNEIIREEALVQEALPKPPEDPYSPVDRSRIRVGAERTFVVAEQVKSFRISYVWIPRPKIEDRHPLEPPVRIPPLLVREHRDAWHLGYPDAVKLELTLQDPERPDMLYEVEAHAPIRLQGHRWLREELSERSGGAI